MEQTPWKLKSRIIPEPLLELLRLLYEVATFLLAYCVVPFYFVAYLFRFTNHFLGMEYLIVAVNPIVIGVLWVVWFIVMAILRRDGWIKLCVAAVLTTITFFFTLFMIFLGVVVTMYGPSYSDADYPVQDLGVVLADQRLVDSGWTERELWQEGRRLVGNAPDGSLQLYMEKRGPTDGPHQSLVLKKAAGEQMDIFEDVSQTLGHWNRFLWSNDGSVLVACFDKGHGRPTDINYSEVCFLKNFDDPNIPAGRVTNVDQFITISSEQP